MGHTATMKRVTRPAALGLAVTSTACVGAGLWLQAAGGQAMPAGFLQFAAVAVGTGALGAFILWHRPGNGYGQTHLAIGVLFATVVLTAGVLSGAGTPLASPAWTDQLALAWSWMAAAVLLPLWVIVIAAFPDGRFHREGVRRATVALAMVMPILAAAAYLFAPPGEPPPLIRVAIPPGLLGPLASAGDPHLLHRVAAVGASVLATLAPIGAVGALIDRFRRAGPVARQQIKWLLAGAAMSVALQAIPVQALDSEVLRTVARIVVVLAVPLPLVAAAIAIFKHGLWEIDVVISKGLVYTLASGVLTALFLGIAFVAGVSVAGRDTRVVAALGLALLVSFLAQPLRQRLEKVVARVLYGDRPHGLMALARLGDVAVPSLDAAELGSRIADAARDTLRSSWTGVWLYVTGDGSETLRPLAVAGAESGPSAILPPWVPTALTGLSDGAAFADLPVALATSLHPLLGDDPALVAALTSRGNLIGLLVCGPRSQDRYGNEDLELLAVVARESALALRNVRLEEELRQRLEEIGQQTAELHSSRQRLVTAQDHERRRIERDLHDGAQQQLVALAARLRRAARTDASEIGQSLDAFADEAEEAVFALQELARGIYPSLLADRGLQAAFQTHAARLPADIRVMVDPAMHTRRFDPQIEAALYFVGLEAITNALKHAPGAHISVSLRGDTQDRAVTLEVHDDGPGFAAGASTAARGLQNMADRIEALGGTLTVDTVPNIGTRIRADIQETAQIRALENREAIP